MAPTKVKQNFGKTATLIIAIIQNRDTRRKPNEEHPPWHKPLSRANLPLLRSRNIRDLHKEIEKTPARKLKKKSDVPPLTLLDIAFVRLDRSGELWQGYFRTQEVLDFPRAVSVPCWTQKITSASSRWKQLACLAH